MFPFLMHLHPDVKRGNCYFQAEPGYDTFCTISHAFSPHTLQLELKDSKMLESHVERSQSLWITDSGRAAQPPLVWTRNILSCVMPPEISTFVKKSQYRTCNILSNSAFKFCFHFLGSHLLGNTFQRLNVSYK